MSARGLVALHNGGQASSVAVGQVQKWAAAKLPFMSDNNGSGRQDSLVVVAVTSGSSRPKAVIRRTGMPSTLQSFTMRVISRVCG
jgi:hypothetical protein